jgi:hypothetical protein
LKVVVAQLGARMHYAVPRIFLAAGLLEALYTDIVADRFPANIRAALSSTCGDKTAFGPESDGCTGWKGTQFPGVRPHDSLPLQSGQIRR